MCNNFLQGVDLPTIQGEEAADLGRPVTLQELKAALSNMTRGKSPGPDGIPPEVLLHFWDVLGPFFLISIQTALEKGAFHEHTNVALISLLPKKGKDPLQCSNYRPISLINSDLKIYSKMLALRLERYMDKLIHTDQAGFMKGRLAADNIRRLMHILEESNSFGCHVLFCHLTLPKPLKGSSGDICGLYCKNFN